MAEVTNNTDTEKDRVSVSLKIDAEHYSFLEDLKDYYRAPTISHTLRLLIEDKIRVIDDEKAAARNANV